MESLSGAHFCKFQKILQISRIIKIQFVAESLGVSESDLFEYLIEWGELLEFKIENECIIVDDIGEFIEGIDALFSDWNASEKRERLLKPINPNRCMELGTKQIIVSGEVINLCEGLNPLPEILKQIISLKELQETNVQRLRNRHDQEGYYCLFERIGYLKILLEAFE